MAIITSHADLFDYLKLLRHAFMIKSKIEAADPFDTNGSISVNASDRSITLKSESTTISFYNEFEFNNVIIATCHTPSARWVNNPSSKPNDKSFIHSALLATKQHSKFSLLSPGLRAVVENFLNDPVHVEEALLLEEDFSARIEQIGFWRKTGFCIANGADMVTFKLYPGERAEFLLDSDPITIHRSPSSGNRIQGLTSGQDMAQCFLIMACGIGGVTKEAVTQAINSVANYDATQGPVVNIAPNKKTIDHWFL